MRKLRYVDRMARRLRDSEPVRPHAATTDVTVEEMETTVEEFYRRPRGAERGRRSSSRSTPTSPTSSWSRKRAEEGRPARGGAPRARTARRSIDKVTYWTGVQRPLVRALVESIEGARARSSTSRVETRRETEHLVEV